MCLSPWGPAGDFYGGCKSVKVSVKVSAPLFTVVCGRGCCRVTCSATSPTEGLRLFETQAWDLVITDRTMPVMDGEQLAALIKERTPQLPILMITGYPESVIHPQLFVAILRKPFSSVDLLAHVARTLGKEA